MYTLKNIMEAKRLLNFKLNVLYYKIITSTEYYKNNNIKTWLDLN